MNRYPPDLDAVYAIAAGHTQANLLERQQTIQAAFHAAKHRGVPACDKCSMCVSRSQALPYGEGFATETWLECVNEIAAQCLAVLERWEDGSQDNETTQLELTT